MGRHDHKPTTSQYPIAYLTLFVGFLVQMDVERNIVTVFSATLSVCPSLCPSACLFIRLFVRPSVCNAYIDAERLGILWLAKAIFYIHMVYFIPQFKLYRLADAFWMYLCKQG